MKYRIVEYPGIETNSGNCYIQKRILFKWQTINEKPIRTLYEAKQLVKLIQKGPIIHEV